MLYQRAINHIFHSQASVLECAIRSWTKLVPGFWDERGEVQGQDYVDLHKDWHYDFRTQPPDKWLHLSKPAQHVTLHPNRRKQAAVLEMTGAPNDKTVFVIGDVGCDFYNYTLYRITVVSPEYAADEIKGKIVPWLKVAYDGLLKSTGLRLGKAYHSTR